MALPLGKVIIDCIPLVKHTALEEYSFMLVVRAQERHCIILKGKHLRFERFVALGAPEQSHVFVTVVANSNYFIQAFRNMERLS